jgi:membrane-associated phospholipid phosphatase
MMKFNSCLKLCWAIFIVLGLCLMGSPALADTTPVMTVDSDGLLNRQVSLSSGESQLESLHSDFLYSFSDDFTFSGADDELLLATNKTYSSALKERPERKSLRGKIKLDSDYFKGMFADTGYALTSPWRWDKSDWFTASIVAGTTGVFFALDEEIRDIFQYRGKDSSVTITNFTTIFEPFGNAITTVPALAGFYIYGKYWENKKAERTALLAVESLLVTGLFTSVLKTMVGRQRPHSGEGADIFKGPSINKNSFPSGHTSSAFAIATVMANEYEEIPYIAPITYGIATLTGMSRVHEDKHWVSDIFFGAMLGYFTSKTILKLHSNKKGRHFTIYPRVDRRGGGLVLSTRF